MVGEPRDTTIASYALRASRRPYQSGAASREVRDSDSDYGRTGSEVEIKSTVNLDQGCAYFPLSVQRQKSGHELRRAEHWEPMTKSRAACGFWWPRLTSAAGTKPRFVVQVTGFGVGLNGGLSTGTRCDQANVLTRAIRPRCCRLILRATWRTGGG